jgi:hypothetical protein
MEPAVPVGTVAQVDWLQSDGSMRYPLATILDQRTATEDGVEHTEYLLHWLDDADRRPFWPLLDPMFEVVSIPPPVAHARLQTGMPVERLKSKSGKGVLKKRYLLDGSPKSDGDSEGGDDENYGDELSLHLRPRNLVRTGSGPWAEDELAIVQACTTKNFAALYLLLPGRSKQAVWRKWHGLHDPRYANETDPANRGKRNGIPWRSKVSNAMMTMPGYSGTLSETCPLVYEKHGHELDHTTGVQPRSPSPTTPP